MRFLGFPEVKARFPYSRATIYRMIKRGQFPEPVQISPGRKGWAEPVIDEYQERLLAGQFPVPNGEAA